MRFEILYTEEASRQLDQLAKDASQAKRLKAVHKTIGLIETNLRHPSLNTHKYESLIGPNGEEIFEAYAENKTPAAFRVFWCYGPKKAQITVIAITPHP